MIHRSAIVGSLFGAALLLLSPAARAAQSCTQNCASITVGNGETAQGTSVTIPISFTEAPSDGQPNQGNDETAAIAFTLGIPGTGASPVPLTLANCNDSDSDGVPDAVQLNGNLASDFKLVVENADCTNRSHCLCPSSGQTRDDYINLVIFGPKDLSTPHDIPVLPSGDLVSIQLQVAQMAPQGPMTLHIFSQVDSGVQKPTFGALLSIGDKSAIDQTCTGTCAAGDVSKVAFTDGTLMITQGTGVCHGDCNHDGKVSTDELVLAVDIALGVRPMDLCPDLDTNDDGTATVDEVVNSVDNALNDCTH